MVCAHWQVSRTGGTATDSGGAYPAFQALRIAALLHGSLTLAFAHRLARLSHGGPSALEEKDSEAGVAAPEESSKAAEAEQRKSARFGDDNEAGLAVVVHRAVGCIPVTPGAGVHAVSWQGRIGSAVGAKETNRPTSGEKKAVRNDVIWSWPASSLKSRGTKEQTVIEGTTRQRGGRERESVSYRAANVHYLYLLAPDKVLAAKRICELNELQMSAAIAVNLVDAPEVECRLGVGERGYSRGEAEGSAETTVETRQSHKTT